MVGCVFLHISYHYLGFVFRAALPNTQCGVLCCADMDLVPASIFQNGQKCILVNVGGAAFGAAGSASGGGGAEAAETPIRLSGPNIIGVDGNILEFKGVNWFGFDVRSPHLMHH